MKRGETVSLLVVEDDEVDRLSLLRALRKGGITNPTRLAEDGVEALQVLRGSPGKPCLSSPYIILLDLNMPRMSGLEFLGEVRRDPGLCRSVVFVLTSSNDPGDRLSAYALNIAGYILKEGRPEAFQELVSLLSQYWRVVELP